MPISRIPPTAALLLLAGPLTHAQSVTAPPIDPQAVAAQTAPPPSEPHAVAALAKP